MTSQVTLSELISQWAKTSNQSRGSLYRAAALKTTFDPLLLQPIDSGYVVSAQERESLLKDSNLLHPESKSILRVLDDDIRRLELRFYKDIEHLKADFIKVNQDDNSSDWVQRMFRAYVFGEAKPLEEQNRDELLGTITVLDWFRGTEIASELALPKLEDALTQAALNATQELLKNIQGETFTNREKELEKLQAYIHSSSALPFTIRGVGGIGKSALVAASLSRELRKATSHQKPLVVWLDFTRNQVFDAADNPFLLLEIIASELIKQLPQDSIELESIRQLLEDDQKRGVLQDDVKLRIQQLAQALQQANRLMVPFYLVMDTLEELQYKDWQTVQDLYEFTENLREYIPHIKAFMIARLKIEKKTDKLDLELKHLDAKSACKLLENMNVPPKDAMRLTKGLSGGHPLSLKVAAQLFNKAQEEGRLNSAVGRLNLINEIIQAQGVEILLDRYIRHVRNENVKKLIRPGMALRRLNAELIYEVLNESCQLALTSKEEAETLFQELRKELYLVEEGREPSELRFRTSIRQELYRYLKADPETRKQLESIHRKAIEFYRNKNSVAERAEEIYHRLASGQSRRTVDKRWEEGVENYLVSILEESLPLPSLAYLANKLGLEAPRLIESEYWQQAQTLVWEVRAERNATRQLKLDKPEEALRIISERKNWTPDSPLYLIEAKALRRQSRLIDALKVIRRALDVCQDQRSESALKLWFLLFWLEMEQGRQQEADQALSVIQDWIGEGRDVEERLEVAIRQLVSLRVNGRNIGNIYQDWSGKAAKAIEDALTSPSKSERPYANKNPKLIRRLVAEISDYRIDLLRKVLDDLGIGEHIPSKARALATSLTHWQGREPNIQLPLEAGLTVPQHNQPDVIDMWLHWLLYESGIKVGQGLAAILGDKFNPPPEVIRDVANLLRFSDEAPREPEVQERRNLIHESEKRRMKNVQRLRQSFSSPDKLDAFLRSQFGIGLAQLTTPPLREDHLALDVAKWAETHGLSEKMQKMLKE